MYASKIPSRTVNINAKEHLFFGGTAYLGIHARPEFGALVKEGIELYGTNYGASRLGNVPVPVFEEAEKKIENWLDAPSALMVSSGTLAGRLMLEALGDIYYFHYGSNAHIAINSSFKKNQAEHFNCSIEETLDYIHLTNHDHHVITFNTVDALTATSPSLDWITRLPKNKKVVLIVDDSHGIGILGDSGRGLYQKIKSLHRDTIMISSLGKAMGLPAGVIVGPAEYIALARSHPLFGGSSPMVPAYAYAFTRADQIYDSALLQLKENISYFHNIIKSKDLFRYLEGFPVFCTDRQDLAAYLEFHEIIIPHFAYPGPKNKVYTRVIINALHTPSDLEKLGTLCNQF
ncbi:MAG: aminotransferase class I/II-fold pyridoxal phosphate-dependent enzyme [Saprospiraceae bacterium]